LVSRIKQRFERSSVLSRRESIRISWAANLHDDRAAFDNRKRFTKALDPWAERCGRAEIQDDYMVLGVVE
jgi:hypothetical protein